MKFSWSIKNVGKKDMDNKSFCCTNFARKILGQKMLVKKLGLEEFWFSVIFSLRKFCENKIGMKLPYRNILIKIIGPKS